MTGPAARPISFGDLGKEPYRLLFPIAAAAGVVGVALWPLSFSGVIAFYPGLVHARIMAHGLFGGFIFGFLGTVLPGMLGARPLPARGVVALALLHVGTVAALASNALLAGDLLFLAEVLAFVLAMAARVRVRKATPPPGFLLVALAFLCVAGGALIAIASSYRELAPFWNRLQHLLSYQGFVLLPILGIGPFILSSMFRRPHPAGLPIALSGAGRWSRAQMSFAAAGALILASFVLEASGWPRAGHALRLAAALALVWVEMPFALRSPPADALGGPVRIAVLAVLAGYLAVVAFPAFRVSLLHLTLIGGFALITFAVATRVLFAHSGGQALLRERNRWWTLAVSLMLFGMATRISGDFWPRALGVHYAAGALVWITGVLIWAARALPRARIVGAEH